MSKYAKAMVLSALGLFAVLFCAGCGGKAEKENKITVSLYDIKLLGEYTDYVESQVPDADIEWMVGKNSLDFYMYLQEKDDLPDIMTSRRFSLLDAHQLQDSLLDLNETELAASYHSIYLDKYRNEDDSVNWLPAPGIFDNLVANKALFEEYDVPLPTDYDSFISACLAFEEKGIRGFVSDYAYDYTCMEILQGLSIEALSSLEGRTWRHDYENKITDRLDDVIWTNAFERVQELAEAGIVRPEDADLDYYMVNEAFVDGKVAMIRGTGAIAAEAIERNGLDVVALPYFGSTEEETWALTYPVFQTAVKKDGNEEGSHRELALDVLDAMYTEDAQNILNETIGAQISYNKDISLALPQEMALMEPLVKQNHIYIRIASNEFFKASMDVFPKMLTGEYDASQAYDAFNEALSQPDTLRGEKAAVLEKSYSYSWDDKKGNEAASSIANTIRGAKDADVLVMPFYSVNCGLYSGEQTLAELGFPVQVHAVFAGEVTGAELEAVLANMVESTPSAYRLPLVSGVTMHVKQTKEGLKLESITWKGKEIAGDEKLTLLYSNKAGAEGQDLEPLGGSERMTKLEGESLQGIWNSYIQDGHAPAEPEEYIVLE